MLTADNDYELRRGGRREENDERGVMSDEEVMRSHVHFGFRI